MHKALSTPEQVELTYKECTTAQRGCVDCKKILMESFDRELVPLRAKRAELDANPDARAGGARPTAPRRRGASRSETMREVRAAMGLGGGADRSGVRGVARAVASARSSSPRRRAATPPPDATPDGAVRLFLDDMEAASDDPRVMQRAYDLLGPAARANLEERAHRTSRLQGRQVAAVGDARGGRFGLAFRPQDDATDDASATARRWRSSAQTRQTSTRASSACTSRADWRIEPGLP